MNTSSNPTKENAEVITRKFNSLSNHTVTCHVSDMQLSACLVQGR